MVEIRVQNPTKNRKANQIPNNALSNLFKIYSLASAAGRTKSPLFEGLNFLKGVGFMGLMELSKMLDAELLKLVGLACEPEEFYAAIVEEKDLKALAVVELGKRAYAKKVKVKTVTRPEDAVRLCADMRNLDHEEVRVLCLNTKNVVFKTFTASKGSADCTVMSPREILREALRLGAIKIIVVHNHPSGDSRPSEEDIKISRYLRDSGKLLGIAVLDCIILGAFDYCSLVGEGLL